MLRDEDRVPAVRRLRPVLRGLGGRELDPDQLVRVPPQRRRPAKLREAAIAPAQPELRAERVLPDAVDPLVELVEWDSHAASVAPGP